MRNESGLKSVSSPFPTRPPFFAPSTHQLDAPSEDGRALVLVVGEWGPLDDLDRVDGRDAAVQLASRSVVVEVLSQGAVSHALMFIRGQPQETETDPLEPLYGFDGHLFALEVADQFVDERRPHGEERVSFLVGIAVSILLASA